MHLACDVWETCFSEDATTAEKYAQEIGIDKIYFHVEKSNEDAFRLYQRLGYKISADEGSRYRMVKEVE